MTLLRSLAAVTAVAVLLMAGCASLAPAPDYAAVVAAPDRLATDRDIDQRRDPVKLLAFTDVRPGMRVLDVNSGAGYTTELLARVVGAGGTVYAQDSAATVKRVQERYDRRLANNPMPNVRRVVQDYADPIPAGVRDFDRVTLLFFYHDLANIPGLDRVAMNRRIHDALKPGGLFIVADHSAARGAGTSVTNTLHRIEESIVRREIEAAGFEFVEAGEFLRNPDDPRDGRVFQSKVRVDEFVLKFRKR